MHATRKHGCISLLEKVHFSLLAKEREIMGQTRNVLDSSVGSPPPCEDILDFTKSLGGLFSLVDV